MKDYTNTIEAVMCEMEDIGYWLRDGAACKFNMINELRSWMGESEFHKFLEQTCRDWDFEHLYHHFDDEE